ncbi:MAG: formate dehydrogenase accessory sulfurtransferase FdhD [Burkholderiaceae bacterium]
MLELTDNPRPSTHEVAAIDETGARRLTRIAGEHPLTLYLDKRELVTLMTLGAAPEFLTLGYLRNQRLIDEVSEIASVQVDWETDSVAITTRGLRETGVTLWDTRKASSIQARLAHKTVTTGCGQGTMFGDLMSEIDQIRLASDARLTAPTMQAMMDNIRHHETIYKQAGAVHGCALCSNSGPDRGEVNLFVEDVGRHNAVDAIAGWMWANGVTGNDKAFYTTGRLTSEMVIKCAQMRIPFLISRSGLTQMGHQIAEQVGMTMLGRCRGKHYLLFTGAERFVREPGDSATALA